MIWTNCIKSQIDHPLGLSCQKQCWHHKASSWRSSSSFIIWSEFASPQAPPIIQFSLDNSAQPLAKKKKKKKNLVAVVDLVDSLLSTLDWMIYLSWLFPFIKIPISADIFSFVYISGYIRIVLLISACFCYSTNPVTFLILYITNVILDGKYHRGGGGGQWHAVYSPHQPKSPGFHHKMGKNEVSVRG